MLHEQKPTISISFHVELEMEYNPFDGRTEKQFAEIVHDDLIDSLWELRDGEVQALHTSLKSVNTLSTSYEH